ncbi:hypothetical protein ACJZ2D_000488 [Fusarium nematophilum]
MRSKTSKSRPCTSLLHSRTEQSKRNCYRKGRVLLASDAAHIHSFVGSQGLILELGGAMNLGWKLAAAIRYASDLNTIPGPVDLSLLDTYESERHPIGSWVFNWTRARILMMQPEVYSTDAYALVRDLAEHTFINCSASAFELEDGSGIGPKLESDRGLMMTDFEDDGS